MFGSFIIGIIFGLGSKYVTGPISEFVSSKIALSEKEMAIVTFGLVMLVASLVASIFTGGGSAFWLILGGTIGVFGFQLIDFAKGKIGEAKAGAEDVAEDVSDAASETVDAVAEKADDAADAVKETVKKAIKS